METNELDVQVRKFITMKYYLNQQLDIVFETSESEKKSTVNADLKKKQKNYIIYSEFYSPYVV